MSGNVTTAFVTYFDPLFKSAYQKFMAKTRDKIRVQTGFQGSTTKFQKVGKGVALSKTRHGKLPIMNVGHDYVTATMATKYAPEMIDAEDLKMTNVDLARSYNEAIAGALAKAYDDMIYTAMDATTNTVAEASSGLTRAKVFAAFEQLNKYNVPGSDRFCAVGPHQWNELLDITEFASADFVGPNYPWLQAANARNWLGIYWYMDPDLPLASVGGTRKCFMWHKQAVGLGELTPFTRTMERLPDADAWLLTGKFTAGAILIEPEGCVEIACDDDATIS